MLKSMSRNIWAAALASSFALALGVSTGGGAASAATSLTVGKAAPNADPIIPVNVGDQLGIFKKHGLDLKIVDFTGGSKMAQAMTAGSLDIGDGAGTEMALVAKGVPMKGVCESASTIPFIGVGVPYDSPAKSLKDLKGKKIGVSSSGSFTDWLAHELSKKEGWGENGVKEVYIGNGAAGIIAAFRGGLVDADIGVTSLFFDMEQKKTGRLLAPVSAYEGPAASGTIYASDNLIKSNPAAIRAFLAGWIETIDYMRTHKAETVKIESGINGFPESVESKQYDLVMGMFTKDCRFDAQSLATLKRSFVELKLLPKAPNMSTLYTEAFLPKK